MLGILLGVFCLGNIVIFTQGASKSRCAVVIFVNQATFNADEDVSDYLKNIKGLSVNKTSVYFSDDPDTFKVNHGKFIDAPGLFALESEKFPGMFLRRTNHTIVLEREHPSENYKNDATFLMDHSEKNETYTALKLFSHRSWKLFSRPDSTGPLLFDFPENIAQHRTGFNLLVIAQPCMYKNSIPRKVVASLKPKAVVNKDSEFVDTSLLRATSPDPTLNRQTNRKYVKAVTNKGKLNTILNEYSFEHFAIPDFIMHSLVEENKNAGDGMEAPKTDIKPSASIFSNNYQQQQVVEHQTKVPIAKQKISELTNVMNAKDADDIEETLRDLQYGSKGCKLLVAEDTGEESATSKDTVAHPETDKKACHDEFPSSCEEMAKKGYCLAFKSLMSTVCRKSCNLCSRLVDTGYTSCTKSCGSGRQLRMIKVNRREYLQTRRCNIQPCPINGGYSKFGNFTECSVTCGKGVSYRRRTCTTPRPQFNGRSCRRLGPSIESKECEEGLCSDSVKPHHQNKNHDTKHETDTEHRKTNLHIDGPHSDGVHQHSILLKGRQVAKLRCTPRKGQLRSIIQDSVTKRFIVHQSHKIDDTKRSDIEEDKILDKKGDPVDESNPVVRAFKSPYKILLARKGPHNTKLVEECVETDEDEDGDHEDEDESAESEDMTIPDDDHNFDKSEDLSDDSATKSKNKQHKNKPGEMSFKDFDEYKYENGNVVTPQVTTFPVDYSHGSSYFALNGKTFGQTKGLDSILRKFNAVSPKVDDQLSNEQGLESSSRPEVENSVDGFTFNREGVNQEGDTDSASHGGFTVTTTPDSNPMKSSNVNDSDNSKDDGYEVESVAEG